MLKLFAIKSCRGIKPRLVPADRHGPRAFLQHADALIRSALNAPQKRNHLRNALDSLDAIQRRRTVYRAVDGIKCLNGIGERLDTLLQVCARSCLRVDRRLRRRIVEAAEMKLFLPLLQ